MTDPISDMLTRMRNALAIGRPDFEVPYSRFKQGLADLLKTQGLIENVEVLNEEKFPRLKLTLKYITPGDPAIHGLKRVSKPGQRIYANNADIPRVKEGMGITVVSTSKGLMTDRDARSAKIGGEIICQIW